MRSFIQKHQKLLAATAVIAVAGFAVTNFFYHALAQSQPDCGNGICEYNFGEDENSCPVDCPSMNEPKCGDGVCESTRGETATNCPDDCHAPKCGDGICEYPETENTCSVDCHQPKCGDGTCDSTESYESCPEDCHEPKCGDGICEYPETAATCPADCYHPTCGDGKCETAYGETATSCPTDCNAPKCGDGKCEYPETAATCSVDCYIPKCGDGVCESTRGETATSCPADCHEPKCGDGKCDTTYGETSTSCPADCHEPKCGDGKCEYPETAATCWDDCGKCGDGICSTNETVTSCPADCGKCGDGFCDKERGEDGTTCFSDCHCGNGTCDAAYGETTASCPNDCTNTACVDSDGGRNSAVQGTVKDATGARTDYCLDLTGVREFYCDSSNKPVSVAITCSTGFECRNGACVAKTEAQPYCGDGKCGTGEDYLKCPADCTTQTGAWKCGDGKCDAALGETNALCPSDCAAPAKCGDGFCNGTETATSCYEDCHVPKCGDGRCETTFGESAKTCLADCHCGDFFCDRTFGETADNCKVDCAGLCGNKVCDSTQGENSTTCPGDCPVTQSEVTEQPCIDSDGGKLPRIAGVTEKGLVKYRDACVSNTEVKEYYCDFGQIRSVQLACIDGRSCVEGVCKYAVVTTVEQTKYVCGNGSCEITYGENNTVCPADCKAPTVAIAPDSGEYVLPPECVKEGITSLDSCKSYMLHLDNSLPASAKCGDGFCDAVIGENWTTCAPDCPSSQEKPSVVMEVDYRCAEKGILSLDKCREFLRQQTAVAGLSEVCIASGIGTVEKCEEYISGLAQRIEPVTERVVSTSPIDSLRVQVDPRCYEVNVLDVTRCATYLEKLAAAAREAGSGEPASTEPVVTIVPPICVENGITEKDDCENYLSRLYVVPECQAAGVLDEEACRAMLAAKRMPSVCVENNVFDEVECLQLQQSKSLPPICAKAGMTTRDSCMQTVFEKYGRPARCQDLSDDACWRLVESGRVNERDFDLKTSAETVPEQCVKVGAVTSDGCRKYLDSMSVPEECRLNGYFSKSACNKYLFDLKSSASETLPTECRAANMADVASCDEYLARIHMPVECAAAGISSERECERYLVLRSMPDECRKAGITSSVECERQLRTKVTQPECQQAGITDSRACAEYTYRKVASKVKCAGLTAEECAMTVKEKKLGTVAAADSRLEDMERNLGEVTDKDGVIDMVKMFEEKPEQAGKMAEKMPLRNSKSTRFTAIASNKAVAVTEGDQVRIVAPVVLTLDTDGDGVPDDVEIRNRLNPNMPETVPGVPDAETFRKRSAVGIDRAIAEGKAIGQPIMDGDTDSSMRIDKVETVFDAGAAGDQMTEEDVSGIKMEGRGTPGEVITLYVYSDLPMVVTTTVDENGQWSFTFDDSLGDGVHEVYVAVNDDTGKVTRKSEPVAFAVRAAQAIGIKAAVAAEATAEEVDLTVISDVNVESTSRASASLKWFVGGGVLLLLAAAGLVVALMRGRR